MWLTTVETFANPVWTALYVAALLVAGAHLVHALPSLYALRKAYPYANIAAVDYDPGASEVNQLNRIKLMLSTARENLNKELSEAR